jgi:hypothetical protein
VERETGSNAPSTKHWVEIIYRIATEPKDAPQQPVCSTDRSVCIGPDTPRNDSQLDTSIRGPRGSTPARLFLWHAKESALAMGRNTTFRVPELRALPLIRTLNGASRDTSQSTQMLEQWVRVQGAGGGKCSSMEVSVLERDQRIHKS